MRIGEYWANDEKPVIDGDYIRGLLILGRQSKNPADTDGSLRGTSKVSRKFNQICESPALYSKFDGAAARIGPHKFDGSYTEDESLGTFHNTISTPKGLRADLLCRKVGESYHPQAIALRDHIQHDRAFGGFSPLFDGQTDMSTGEVQTVDGVCSIDWVPQAASTKSIAESDVEETFESRHAEHTKRLDEHETRIAECEARMGARIAEAVAEALEKSKEKWKSTIKIDPQVWEAKIAESLPEDKPSGIRTQPIPTITPAVQSAVDPFKFIRNS